LRRTHIAPREHHPSERVEHRSLYVHAVLTDSAFVPSQHEARMERDAHSHKKEKRYLSENNPRQ
jgi:hypothetical protein